MLPLRAGHSSHQCPILHLQNSVSDRPQQQSGRDCTRFCSRPSTSRQRSSSSSSCSSSGRGSLTICAAHSWSTGCRVAGCGSSVPAAVLTNHDLEKLVDTNDEWIRVRTGISRRHVLGEHETLSQHSARAAQNAMDMAHVTADQVDLVLLATSSPDDTFGSACQVQALLGAKHALAFDITAACSGFVVAMNTAAQFIRTGTYKNVVVIGADCLSRYVDWRDRSTCILFGDASGAVVMQAQTGDCALLGSCMRSDGTGHKHLKACYEGQGHGMKATSEQDASSLSAFHNISMNGQEVFRFAVRAVPDVIEGALIDAGLAKADVDWLVMHQANQRILKAAAERLHIPMERVVSNLNEYGNTSAASIPLALDEAVRAGSIQKGDVIASAGFGAGLTWAGAIYRWG